MSERIFNCTDIELVVCDYLDNTLSTEDKLAFEAHAASCAVCAELVSDTREALGFIERCADVQPPQELVTKIMHQLPVAKQEAKRQRGLGAWVSKLFAPVLQPKFAMGMAMTILSFSMLGKFVGPVKPLRAADLDPMRVVQTIDDRIHRLWTDGVKYYESLRLVYEIQTRLSEWAQEDDAERDRAAQKKGEASEAARPAQSNSGGKK